MAPAQYLTLLVYLVGIAIESEAVTDEEFQVRLIQRKQLNYFSTSLHPHSVFRPSLVKEFSTFLFHL